MILFEGLLEMMRITRVELLEVGVVRQRWSAP
jgi:hypothetical protein